MKKKDLKLNKKIISNLQGTIIIGGASDSPTPVKYVRLNL